MKILRWTARVLSVPVILFFIASLLGERSAGTLSLLDWVKLGLWFVIMIGLLLSWKWEIVGSLIVIAAFLIMVILNPVIVTMWAMWVSPVTAVLFLLCGLYFREAEPMQPAG